MSAPLGRIRFYRDVTGLPRFEDYAHLPRTPLIDDPHLSPAPALRAGPLMGHLCRSDPRFPGGIPMALWLRPQSAIRGQPSRRVFDRSDHTSPGRRPHSIHGNEPVRRDVMPRDFFARLNTFAVVNASGRHWEVYHRRGRRPPRANRLECDVLAPAPAACWRQLRPRAGAGSGRVSSELSFCCWHCRARPAHPHAGNPPKMD
jgi:hypothetical protein